MSDIVFNSAVNTARFLSKRGVLLCIEAADLPENRIPLLLSSLLKVAGREAFRIEGLTDEEASAEEAILREKDKFKI